MFPSGPSFRFPPTGLDELHEAVGWWTPADDQQWSGPGVVGLALALSEARTWISRAFDGQQRQPWKSAMADVLLAAGRCGPHLRVELGQDLVDVEDLAGRLLVLLSSCGKIVKSAVSGWLAGAPVVALDGLRARLTAPGVRVAAWRDLVEACRAAGTSADEVAARRDMFRELLAGAEFNPRSTGRVLAGVLHDSSAWVTEARVLLGDLNRGDVEDWPGPDDAAGLDDADRLALCERLIGGPPPSGRHVVWLAFAHASTRNTHFAVGPITFYPGFMTPGMIGKSGPGNELVPAELGSTDGWLKPEDIPTDDDLVFARVDLGHGSFADPVRRATDIAHATVSIARFRTGAGNWTPWTGHMHALDGRVTGMPSFLPPDPKFTVEPFEDPTSDVLQDLAVTLGPHLSPVPEELHEAIAAVRWWQETGEGWNLPGVVLDVRIIEWVASAVAGGAWYDFLTATWKQQWIRNQIRYGPLETCIEAARRPNAVAREHRVQLDDIAAKIQQRHGRIRTLHLNHALDALPDLRAIYPLHTPTGRRIASLADRLTTVATVDTWCTQLEADWTSQLNRLRRLRNALAHGGPAPTGTVDRVGPFGRELAKSVLAVTLTSYLDGRGPVTAHSEVKTNADSWRAGILIAPDVATAVFA